MSSSVYLSFHAEVSSADWIAFCEQNGVGYSPNTMGQSTFYSGQTEITLKPEGTVEKDEEGFPIWSTARPPESFGRMSVSTYFGGNLDSVGAAVNAIVAAFPCTASSSPELAHLLVDVPQTHHIEEKRDFMSTDFVAAWSFRDGEYSARVDAGEARVYKDGENWKVDISGVKRGTFVDLNHAFAFAGRATWDWWYGPRATEQSAVHALPRG